MTMSYDAGSLAQMAYNRNNNNVPVNNGNLGLPGSGFASRGKNAHVKRLSVAPPANIGSIDEEAEANPTPRSSRAQLLAGLRTAPRVSGQGVAASAPPNRTSFDDSFSGHQGQAAANHYGQQQQPMQHHNGQQMFYNADQILAPPSLNFDNDGASSPLDPQVYSSWMMTNMYLAQRQQQLQQQLMNVQAAAAQFQGMNMNGSQQQQQQQSQQFQSNPLMMQSSLYNQQLRNGMQPNVQAVPNQPGVYSVFNPMTGQTTFVRDPAVPQQHLPASPPESSPEAEHAAFPKRADLPNPPKTAGPAGWTRNFSPPRQSPSPPQDVTPLPEASATAWRPGHRKGASSAMNRIMTEAIAGETGSTPRTGTFPRTPGTAATPTSANGTFGLGLGRAGEHPIRQPRGPPPLEELTAAPTSKHEGSKNFATRQRRRALFNLVRAGNERRGGRSVSPVGDSPLSDADPVNTSDNESDTTPATGSITADSSTESVNKTSNASMKDTFARRLTESPNSAATEEKENSAGRRRMPMLVLTSAEKRKSSYSP